MEFRYIDYSEDLLQRVLEGVEPRVYVFSNTAHLAAARERHTPPLLGRQSLFITLDELRERLFVPDRILLREEKLALIFYGLLTEEEREYLGVDDYFSTIEPAADFFALYAELRDYGLEEGELFRLKDLKKWQRERLNLLSRLRRRYITRMEELGYTDRTLCSDFHYFQPQWLRDYGEIRLVNITDLAPLEREGFARLEKDGKRVELFLQLHPGDFDEKGVGLSSYTLPDDPQVDIRLYRVDDELLQNAGWVSAVEDEPGAWEVLDADPEHHLQNLIDGRRVKAEPGRPFTHTGIYRCLQALYAVLSGVRIEHGSLRLELDGLLEACGVEEFRRIYSITGEDLERVEGLVREEFAALSKGLVFEMGPGNGLAALIEDIEQIRSLRNLSGFLSFLRGMRLERVDCGRHGGAITQYLDGLAELKAVEELGLVTSWSAYFDDLPRGLFRLVLNYLRYKRVEEVGSGRNSSGGDRGRVRVRRLANAPPLQRDGLVILNVSRGVCPVARGGGSLLLTEEQRSRLGLPTEEDRRERERYEFFRHVLTGRRSVIFGLENPERNITISSLMEELRMAYDLDISGPPFGPGQYPGLVRDLFPASLTPPAEVLPEEFRGRGRMRILSRDIPRRFGISYSAYSCLTDCAYRFFLEHLSGLEGERPPLNGKLSRRLLGIIIHDMMARVLSSQTEVIVRGGGPEREAIETLCRKTFADYELKVPAPFRRYYRGIILPRLVNSIRTFLERMQKRLRGPIRGLHPEWSPEPGPPFLREGGIGFHLKGRVDLLVETTREGFLVDFKSGGGDRRQLEFYALLLKGRTVPGGVLRRGIYSVMSRELVEVKPGGEEDFSRELSRELESFLEEGAYRAEYGSRCRWCDYTDLCRVVKL